MNSKWRIEVRCSFGDDDAGQPPSVVCRQVEHGGEGTRSQCPVLPIGSVAGRQDLGHRPGGGVVVVFLAFPPGRG